ASDFLFHGLHGETRLGEWSLNVHAVIHDIRNKLGVRQRLVGSAHDTESDMRISLLHESGNNGVKRPLARRPRIGMAGIEQKQSATVVQHKAPTLHRDSGTESVVQALYERCDVAVLVDGGQVSRVAPGRGAAGRSAVRLRGINQR